MKDNLKKINLIVVGSFIVLSVVGFNFLKHFGARLDRNSKEFVDIIIVEIAEDWDVQTFLRYASPDLHQSINNEDLKMVELNQQTPEIDREDDALTMILE